MNKITFKQLAPFLVLSVVAIAAIFVKPIADYADTSKYSTADIAWVIVATALVFLMTPGLAFFYGGMVHRKNVISTMIKSVVAAGVVSILWVVVGYSLCFGDSIGGFIGSPTTHLFFKGVNSGEPILQGASAPLTIPLTLFALFQLMFAIITPGLVVGAVAERIRFTAYILFIALFSLLVYAPIAHWTWHPKGFLFGMGVLDFAGGTVVHISAGCAALAGALVLKRRKVHLEHKEIPPANIPYVLIGTGLLWFGWFGFNAGSALAANGLAVQAFATTNMATASAMITWVMFDALVGRKISAMGACIGAVVGLVAITPGAGFVNVGQSVFIGFAAAIVSNLAVYYKQRTSLDDTLDVFPCHGLGGIVGMILTGVFAKDVGLINGKFQTFQYHLLALVVVGVFTFGGSYLIFKLTGLITRLRVSPEDERLGLDISQHSETLSTGEVEMKDNQIGFNPQTAPVVKAAV